MPALSAGDAGVGSARLVWACAAVAAAAVLAFSFTLEIYQYGDNCGYMTLGMSLARGRGFTNLAIPGYTNLLWWPHGFPLFLSLFCATIGPQWAFIKVLIFLLLFLRYILIFTSDTNKDVEDTRFEVCVKWMKDDSPILRGYTVREISYVFLCVI